MTIVIGVKGLTNIDAVIKMYKALGVELTADEVLSYPNTPEYEKVLDEWNEKRQKDNFVQKYGNALARAEHTTLEELDGKYEEFKEEIVVLYEARVLGIKLNRKYGTDQEYEKRLKELESNRVYELMHPKVGDFIFSPKYENWNRWSIDFIMPPITWMLFGISVENGSKAEVIAKISEILENKFKSLDLPPVGVYIAAFNE